MMLYEEFEKAGYEKHGYWFMINNSVSVNLQTKQIKSGKSGVEFSVFREKINFEEVERIRKFIESF